MPEQVILDMTKTYMYQDEEYILSGRTAVKTHDPRSDLYRKPRPMSRSGKSKPPPKDLMVEITPAPRRLYSDEPPLGMDAETTKWVKYSDLYMVYDQLHENEEAEDIIAIEDDGIIDFDEIMED